MHLDRLEATSVQFPPPPALSFRDSSVPPPFLLRPSSLSETEEGRRRDGGRTEEGRWELPATAVLAAIGQARNFWHRAVNASSSCCHRAHPYDKTREIPEENSPVLASGRFITASESVPRGGSSETGGMGQRLTAPPNRVAPRPAGHGRLPQPMPARPLRKPIRALALRTGATDCPQGTCAPSMRSSCTLSPSSAACPVSGAFAPEKAAQTLKCAAARSGFAGNGRKACAC